MDFWESMNIVHKRIQEIEPENASKIFCYLLLMQENGEREMIRLAFCPDSVMHSVINCVKYELAKNAHHYHHTHTPPHHLSTIKFGSLPVFYESSSEIDQFFNFDDSWTNSEFSNAFYPHQRQYLPLRMSRRSPSLPEFPVKTCHYFNKGFCKHGNNCRYVHEKVVPERGSFAQMFNPNLSDEDHVVSPGSLEKLEGEIVELLKSRRGIPISIASLPMIYYEKYGRILQAEGYLTESQRHGKAGYSLTKLLARLNNTIRLIDRPHGQHSVILAEDVSKYLEYSGGGERNEQQRQIYLTFPAESSFTSDEVSNYFSTFGHVEDVRIPTSNSEKRMFGFVTFSHTETVKEVLSQGNPHFICGARVLVKPYKEKSRCIRHDTTLHGMRYGSQFLDRDLEMNTLSMRVRESSSRQIRKPFRSRYEQSHSVSKSLPNNFSYLGFSSDDLNQTSNEQEEQQVERLNYLLGYLNTEDNDLNIATNFRDEDSQVLNLPESPFSPLSGKEISTVT